MHAFIIVVVWLSLILVPAPAHTQDAEALRRELEQLKRQQEEYQKAIEALSERLKKLESQPAPAAVSPAPAPTAGGVAQTAPLSGGAMTPTPSLIDLARPRQPFALYGQRGAGQLFFDMGVSADFIGNVTQRNVDKANAGSFPDRENRFFPREVELNIFGQIDPYAFGVFRIETGEEEPGAEAGVNLAEAYLTLLTLPYGTQLKIGQVRNRFGLLNEHHRDALPQPDVPNVLLRFLGEEGLVERGAELTWVPALPFYIEALVGVFDGDNEEAFGRGKLNEPLLTARVRTFFELSDEHAIQFGVSGARGKTPDRLSSNLIGGDVKYKWRPEGWLHPLLTVGAESIYSIRETENDLGEKTTRDRFGWYTWAEIQPWRRWGFGARFDSTQYPVNPGREWAVEPYVAFYLSEFLRFRLAYKHTERTHRDGFTDNGGSARIADELFFQYTFILGAHPAHPF